MVSLVALLSGPLAVAGPNFILDDWFALSNAAFDGPLRAGGDDQLLARPGAWLVYALEFGLIGRHPLPIYLLQTVANAAVAVVLLHLARRYVGPATALCITVVWVIMPNHGSLENWASTLNIVIALLFLLIGCLLLTEEPTPRRTAVTTLLFVCAALTYEAVIPTATLALVAVPRLERRALRVAHLAPPLVGLAGAGAWLVLHWHPYKDVRGWADLSRVIPGHFGWGVGIPLRISGIAAAIALAVIVASAGRLILPSLRHGASQADGLIVAGSLVIVAGTVPFVRYYYVPLGVDDRVHVVAAIGAAMCWTGMALLVWQRRRSVAIALGALVVTAMATVNVQRDLLYAQAGRDVLETFTELDEAMPVPRGSIMAGPLPLAEQNIVGLLDLQALQVHRGTRDVFGLVALDEKTYQGSPAHLRFDQWEAIRGRPPDARGLSD